MNSSRSKISFEEFLTVRRAAEFMGVSPSTLRNWDRRGKLQARRHPLNGYRLYRRSDLEALLLLVEDPSTKD